MVGYRNSCGYALSFVILMMAIVTASAKNSPTPNLQGSLNYAHSTHMASKSRDQQVAFAKLNLADKLQVIEAQISLVSIQSVTWRSGALGCPKPGMMYTQALVPGVLVLLKVGESIYRYHASVAGTPTYCPAERAQTPSESDTFM
jgi:hypothetical protein